MAYQPIEVRFEVTWSKTHHVKFQQVPNGMARCLPNADHLDLGACWPSAPCPTIWGGDLLVLGQWPTKADQQVPTFLIFKVEVSAPLHLNTHLLVMHKQCSVQFNEGQFAIEL